MTQYQINIFNWSNRRWRAAVNGSDGSQWEGPLCRSKGEARAVAESHVEIQKALEKPGGR